MGLQKILGALDAEIGRLRQAAAILSSSTTYVTEKRGPGRPKSAPGSTSTPTTAKMQRDLLPEGRARIAAMDRARWTNEKKKTK